MSRWIPGLLLAGLAMGLAPLAAQEQSTPQTAPKPQPFEKLRIIKERYCPTIQAMGHISSRQFKNRNFRPAGAVCRKIRLLFLNHLLFYHINLLVEVLNESPQDS